MTDTNRANPAFTSLLELASKLGSKRSNIMLQAAVIATAARTTAAGPHLLGQVAGTLRRVEDLVVEH